MSFSNLVLSFLALVAVFGLTQSISTCPSEEMCYGQGNQQICTRTTSGWVVKHYNRCMKEKYDCESNQYSQEIACPVPPMTSNPCPTCNQPDIQKIICTRTRDGRTVKHFSQCMKDKFVCENYELSQEVACPATNPCPSCNQPDIQKIICTRTRDGRTVKHFSQCMKDKFVCENYELSQEVACPATNPCPTCNQPDVQEIICTKTKNGITIKHYSRCMKNKFVCENNELSQEVACPVPPMTFPDTKSCPTCNQPITPETICTKTRDGRTIKHYSRCLKDKFVCENNELSQEVACPGTYIEPGMVRMLST